MKIKSVRWTPAMNMLVVECSCGRRFEHRADRWTVRCECGAKANLMQMRERVTWV